MEQVDEIISILESMLGRNYFSTSNIHKLNELSVNKLFFKTILEKTRKIYLQYLSVKPELLYDMTMEPFEKWRNYHSVNYEITQSSFSEDSIYSNNKSIVFDELHTN